MNYSFVKSLLSQCQLIITVGLHAGSVTPVSQMRKLELSALKDLVQSHLAGNGLAENLRVAWLLRSQLAKLFRPSGSGTAKEIQKRCKPTKCARTE